MGNQDNLATILTILAGLGIAAGAFYYILLRGKKKPKSIPPAIPIGTGEGGTEVGLTNQKDKFGVKKIYEDKTGQKQWYSNFSNKETLLSAGLKKRVPSKYDSMMHLHCHDYAEEGNKAEIENNICTLSGNHVRLYVTDPGNVPIWYNTEQTAYFKLIKKRPMINSNYSTFRLASRSNHNREFECIWNGLGYGCDYRLDKRKMEFRKERAHSFSAVAPISYVPIDPMSQWIGFKHIMYNVDSDTHVKFKTYIDLTDGKDGGDWKLVPGGEWKDDGNWTLVGDELTTLEKALETYTPPGACIDAKPVKPYTQVATRPGCATYFRADWVDKIQIKKASIRNIKVS